MEAKVAQQMESRSWLSSPTARLILKDISSSRLCWRVVNVLQISIVEDQLVWGNLHPDIWETILLFDTVPISDTTGAGDS